MEVSKKKRVWFYTVLASSILMVALILQAFYSRRQVSFTELKSEKGFLDISEIDFTDEIYTVSNSIDYYPNRLYTHEDFERGVEDKPLIAGKDISTDEVPFGTYRLLLKGKPLELYAFCGYSMDYSTKVFVNGAETVSFGKVADNKEDSVPGGGYMTIPLYTDEKGLVEIIYQYSNFVHREGGFIPAIHLSTMQNIEEYQRENALISVGVGGAMLMLALYFFLSASIQMQKTYLYLAFCCLVMAFRDNLFWGSYVLPEGFSWYFTYRTSITVVALLPFSFILLLKNIYQVGNKWVHRVYVSMDLISVLLISLVNTRNAVLYSKISYVLSLPYLLYLLVEVSRYLIKKRKLVFSDVLSLTGMGVWLLALLTDALLAGKNSFATRHGFAPVGMLLFILLVSISVSLKVQYQEIALQKSKSRTLMLEKMNTMNMDFLHNVAHELKTPLTIISGYAQLTGLQLATDRIDKETPENLKTIQSEANRLGDIVTKLMEYSYGKETNTEFYNVSVKTLLRNVQAICVPMCLKNKNKVVISDVDSYVYGNGEMLLQIFINLAVNANRHTKNGEIEISATEDRGEQKVIFRVKDTGSGIPEEHLPHIFEKGYSTDGSSGLGLSICGEAVEAHKGQIYVEKTDEEGTVIAFTVPLGEGEKN